MLRHLDRPRCIGCDKTPEQIMEYVEAAREMKPPMTPSQYVVFEEGTYAKHAPNSFYCTTCYIKAGMPSNPQRSN